MRIKENIENKIVISKSEFITYLGRCFSDEECRAFIAHVRKMHPQATHVCSAYITNEKMIKRTNDDGEPSKTAGMPMLDALEKNDMEDICACVVRYFGGIKLGAGGLVRAYSNSVSEALKVADKVEVCTMKIYQLIFGYDWIDKLNYFLKDYYIADKQYEQRVSYLIYLNNDEELDKIIEYTNGKVEVSFVAEKEVEKLVEG